MSPEGELTDAQQLRGVFLAWTTLAVAISAAIAVATLTHHWGVW